MLEEPARRIFQKEGEITDGLNQSNGRKNKQKKSRHFKRKQDFAIDCVGSEGKSWI